MFGMLRDWRLESGLWWSLRQAGALVDRLLCALAPVCLMPITEGDRRSIGPAEVASLDSFDDIFYHL
jgi:hypothetical protein